MQPQMANYIANFVSREPSIDSDRHIVEPELGFATPSTNVHMRWFTTFVGIEERAIRTPS